MKRKPHFNKTRAWAKIIKNFTQKTIFPSQQSQGTRRKGRDIRVTRKKSKELIVIFFFHPAKNSTKNRNLIKFSYSNRQEHAVKLYERLLNYFSVSNSWKINKIVRTKHFSQIPESQRKIIKINHVVNDVPPADFY